MQTYLIEPKAPLVVRSGRPFDEQNGTDAARFPPPSTLAGALRTAHAESSGLALDKALAAIPVAGPLPVKIDAQGNNTLLVPKPADALYFYGDDKKSRRPVRCVPQKLESGEGCDLPYQALLPVQLAEDIKGKPAPGPRWWSWADLIKFRNSEKLDLDTLEKNGWSPHADEVRTHVGIDQQSYAAESGRLFQTSGLVCWQCPDKKQRHDIQDKFPHSHIGLIGCIEGSITSGLITLGGERRLSAIQKATTTLWPVQPDELAAEIQQAGGLTLTLLTPALFTKGWHPGWLDDSLKGAPLEINGLLLRLRSAALERWQPHSGWDLVAQQPRAGRKLVAAGGVFWFEICKATPEAIKALWLAHISDDTQDRLDGFGLALPQPWRPVQATI